jgi:hypothetical protein
MLSQYHHQQLDSDQRRAAILQQAQGQHLADLARAGRRPIRFYRPALAHIGRWMVLYGSHLQKRYGVLSEPAIGQPPIITAPQPR